MDGAMDDATSPPDGAEPLRLSLASPSLSLDLFLSLFPSLTPAAPLSNLAGADERAVRNSLGHYTKMTCAICLEELDSNPTSLPCGHSFHNQCMLTAALCGHRRCPTCRAPCLEDTCDAGEVVRRSREAIDHFWEEERQQRREHHRTIQRGLRLAREGRAPPEVASAVAFYRDLLAERSTISRERQAIDRAVRAHARHLRATITQLQRDAPPQIARLVEARVYVNSRAEDYWELMDRLQRARDAIAAAVTT